MKIIHSFINGQTANHPCMKVDVSEGKEVSHILSNCIAAKNSSDTNVQMEKSKNKSANVIKRFFKKTIAAQSYNKMFSQGANFKELGIELAESSTQKASFQSLQHLNNLSKKYVAEIKDKVQELTSQEKILLSKVLDAKIHFRHQSNSNLVSGTGTLNILSLDKLKSNDVCTATNTYIEDVKYLNNQDFVFFGVEFSDDKTRLPLNTRHTTVDFGGNAYIVDEQIPYGYLTLTDHFDNIIPPEYTHEHRQFFEQFSEVRHEIYRKVHGNKSAIDIPIFNTKDMRLGLGLHLIEFLRKSNDSAFKKFALNEKLENEHLDKILNFVFQPEFHAPRIVSINNFTEVKLRDINLTDAIKASNFNVISEHLKNKGGVNESMRLAIKNAKKDVVDFLFSKFPFTKEDIRKISRNYEDIEFALSSFSADEKILKIFLERGLIEANYVFKKTNAGDTMLDNAIKYDKKEMIELLLKYGAVSGRTLKNN